MDRFALEAFLYSADFGDDNYLLGSSSSSESEEECRCPESMRVKVVKIPGYMEKIVPELLDSDFKNKFKVSRKTAEKVTELLATTFLSDHKGGWERITPSKAAHVFLWYLGNKETFKQVSERFKITMSCIYNIIKLGTRHLSSRLKEFVCWPSSEEYSSISDLYFETSNIRGAIGSVGISHFKILKPKEDPEKYFNIKEYWSVAVQGITTINHKFIDINISEGGQNSIKVISNSSVVDKADHGLFEEYFLVCNSNYPVLPWLIPPYSKHLDLTDDQTVFNKCHYAAWSILPQAFGFLKGRFQRLQSIENRDIDFIGNVIKSACIIHNIAIDLGDDCDFFIDDEGIIEEENRRLNREDDKRLELLQQCISNCYG